MVDETPPPVEDNRPPWELYSAPEGVTPEDRASIAKLESGGNYKELGPVTRTGDRAYGKYQVMGSNIPQWTQEALGRSMTPQQFLNDPQAQEDTFGHRFGMYKQKHGAENAARAWLGGEGSINRPDRRDQLGTSVESYGRRFMAGRGTPQESPLPDTRPPWELFSDLSQTQSEEAPAQEAPTPPTTSPGPPGTATMGEALGRGVEQVKGALGGTAELAGELTGYDPLKQYGRGIRETATTAQQQYPAPQEFLKIQSARDAAQWAKDAIFTQVPQIGTTLAGGLVGGALGGPPGALAGALLPSLPLNIGDIQSQLKQEAPEAEHPGYVLAGGTAAAALDAITPFRLGSRLLTTFGKEAGEQIAKEVMEKGAQKSVIRQAAGVAGKDALVEGTTEAAQEVIGEYAVAGALDRPPDWDTLPARMIEAGTAGGLVGGVFGGATHVLSPNGHAIEVPPGQQTDPRSVPEVVPGDIPPYEVPPGTVMFSASEELPKNSEYVRAYHGTAAPDFTKFDTGKSPDEQQASYFSSSPETASDYVMTGETTGMEGARIYPVDLPKSEIYHVSFEEMNKLMEDLSTNPIGRMFAGAAEEGKRIIAIETQPGKIEYAVQDPSVIRMGAFGPARNDINFTDGQFPISSLSQEEVNKLFHEAEQVRGGRSASETDYPKRGVPLTYTFADGSDARPSLEAAAHTIWRIGKQMGMTTPVRFYFHPGLHRTGSFANVYGILKNGMEVRPTDPHSPKPDGYAINLWVGSMETPAQVWTTLSHEFGHALMSELYTRNASPLLKVQIDEAYQRYRAQFKDSDDISRILKLRNSFIKQWYGMTISSDPKGRPAPGEGYPNTIFPISTLSGEKYEYWTGISEWFADQVARHFTTQPKATNAVDKFFSKLATEMHDLYDQFQKKFGILAEPDQWISQWLDSLIDQRPMVGLENSANKQRLADANARAMKGIGVPDYPETQVDPSSIPGRRIISAVGEDADARAMAAAGDRFNGFYRWGLSVVQVAARNLHIKPLQRYVELWQQKQLERAQIMSQAMETLRQWKNLGSKQADAVSAMIDDYMNMRYLTAQEIAAGVERRPTQQEKEKLARDNNVNPNNIATFDRIISDFDAMLLRYEGLLRSEALKIIDPQERAKKLTDVTKRMAALRASPYAPAMRFGDLVVLVKDVNGNTISRYHYETERRRKQAVRAIEKQLAPGESIELTALPEQAKPFMGIPPGMLDLIGEKLNLTKAQQKALEDLKYEYAPAHGFQHRFQRKHKVPGYSQDFMRAYANYFFHGSNYFTNVKYVSPLRDEIGLVKLSAEGLANGTKRIQIHNFLDEHLNYMLDPRPDFAHIRGAMFHWALGFSPTAAFINLSQMALGSYPFLASKFGDTTTIAAMTRAGTNLSTFYKKGTLAANTTQRDIRALNEGVQRGFITEAMAPELAGLTEQDNLRKGAGWSTKDQLWHSFQEYSAFMFQTTEQINRRVTFRAAWQMALDNPSSKYVQESVQKWELLYNSLVAQGWAKNEAAAFVTAADSTQTTQFIYHQWANPRFMRGKLRTAFVFKNFLQNTMFNLWHYPDTRIRALLAFGFLGGLMGLPGSEDMKNLIKAIGFRLFGKDWDVEDEARKLVKEITNGTINADTLLHGFSRYGFGIPAVLGLMGAPAPNFDLSRSVGLGRLLPFDPNVALGQGATKDPSKAALDTITQSLGYAFQLNANFYGAITDSNYNLVDSHRWVKVMPRTLGGLTRAWQAMNEGAVKTRTGANVITFDPSDAAQMTEILGMAAGLQPTRLTAKWDLLRAQQEAIQFWDLKRQALLRQAAQARSSDDPDNYQRAIQSIRDFNANLPDDARGQAITADQIIQSIRARVKGTAKYEAGIAQHKRDIPLVRQIQELYPEAEVDVRRTR